ncbi:MAG: MFS transporter [Aeromicrobium sp.]
MAAPSIVASTSDVPKPLLVAVLASASLLISTLFNLVIPLIPVLPGELNASPGNTSWVVTAFFLVGAVANPVAGRLADMVGNRRVLIVCVWLLVVGSVVCALASTLPVLLAGRVLQGMSLPMMSISLSIMRQQLVIVRLPAAVGWATAAMGIGNGAGLIGGGYLIDTFSWNAVFWATAVISLPLAVAVPLVVPRDHRADPQRLDATGPQASWRSWCCSSCHSARWETGASPPSPSDCWPPASR